MQFERALLASVLATAACTDGVGMPIREELQRDDASAEPPDTDAGTPQSCRDIAEWLPEDSEAEDALLDLINALRIEGFMCYGDQYSPRHRLRLASELRCSARRHSRDMATHGFVGRIGSDGSEPSERMAAAGFRAGESDELIVEQDRSPSREILQSLLERDRDGCETVSDWDFTHIGVGRYGRYWTVDFAEDLSEEGMPRP